MVPADRKRTEHVLSAVIFAIVALQGTLPFMDHVTLLRPLKCNLYILRFDELVGIPGFLLAQLVRKSFLLTWVVLVTYGVLHLAIVVAFTATLYLRPQDTWPLFRTFVANLLLAVLV